MEEVDGVEKRRRNATVKMVDVAGREITAPSNQLVFLLSTKEALKSASLASVSDPGVAQKM